MPESPFRARRHSGGLLTGRGGIETEIGRWPLLEESPGPARGFRYWTFVRDPSTSSGLQLIFESRDGWTHAGDCAYLLQTAGPQEALIDIPSVLSVADAAYFAKLLYDPTNGALSFGNCFGLGGEERLAPLPEGGWDDNLIGAIRGVELE